MRGRTIVLMRADIARAVLQRLASALVCLLVLAACSVQLAPDYDKSIVEGLTSANQEAMTLFATVSPNVPKSTFPDREKSYNSIIGKFAALKIEADSRPVPQPLLLQWFGSTRAGETLLGKDQILKVPTPDVLDGITKALTRMRDEDKASGLMKERVEFYQNGYEIRIQQALVYEKALQR